MKKFILLLSLLLCSTAFADTIISTKTTVLSSTPTIDTAIYASGDSIGGLITLTNAAYALTGSGFISYITIADKDREGADIDVVFFTSNPSATTFTNNAALTINDADLVKIACVVNVTTDAIFVDNGVSYVSSANCPFDLGYNNTTLYAALVSRGTPTYTSTSDLTLRVGILQD